MNVFSFEQFKSVADDERNTNCSGSRAKQQVSVVGSPGFRLVQAKSHLGLRRHRKHAPNPLPSEYKEGPFLRVPRDDLLRLYSEVIRRGRIQRIE
jgi:hypothetical protein